MPRFNWGVRTPRPGDWIAAGSGILVRPVKPGDDTLLEAGATVLLTTGAGGYGAGLRRDDLNRRIGLDASGEIGY